MSFVSVSRMFLLLLIVSLLLVYAVAQNTSNFNVGNPTHVSHSTSLPTHTPPIPTPDIGPIRRESPVYIYKPIRQSDGLSRIRTPDPQIVPNFTKSHAFENPVSKEIIPEISPHSQPQRLVVESSTASPPPLQSKSKIAYPEVAPDTSMVYKRIQEPLPPRVEPLPSSIPIPKQTKVLHQEAHPTYRVEYKPEAGIPPDHMPPKVAYQEDHPDAGVPPSEKPPKAMPKEQSPEEAPLSNPSLVARNEEEPKVLPIEDIPNEEKQPVKETEIHTQLSIAAAEDKHPPQEEKAEHKSKAEEKPPVKETQVRTQWSIASIEDKHPPQEEKTKGKLETKEVKTVEITSTEMPTEDRQAIQIKDALTHGAFIQLASYRKQDDATNAAESPRLTTSADKIFVYKIPSSQYYKLVAGPFKKDDIGVQLLSLNRRGFSDAFVLRKH